MGYADDSSCNIPTAYLIFLTDIWLLWRCDSQCPLREAGEAGLREGRDSCPVTGTASWRAGCSWLHVLHL